MASIPSYAELRCHSNYSFLWGASHPEDLVDRAARLGLSALALTDVNGLYGSVKAWVQAQRHDLALIIGAELSCDDEAPLTLLAQNREGYAHLCRLLSKARLERPKGEPGVALEEVLQRAEGLCALYPGARRETALRLREAFGERLSLSTTRHLLAGDEARIREVRALGRELKIAVAVTQGARIHDRSQKPLLDVLTCIRLGISVQEAGRQLLGNAECVLKSPEEMAELWRDFPQGLERAAEVAAACHFRLDEIRSEHPLPPVGVGDERDPMATLRRLCEEGLQKRYPDGASESVLQQLNHELGMVSRMDYPAFFLTVWDLVRFARSRGILCQGRGSAANSIICYVLEITAIDPVEMNLLFERFISEERGEPPDIDVDFEHERREEVIQYVYNKYGCDHAGMVCEVITYKARSALREVGKAMGLSVGQADRLAAAADTRDFLREDDPRLLAEAGLEGEVGAQVLAVARKIQGFPRHLSIHVGGFCITRRPLAETVPIEPATMEGRTVVQWDKDDLAALNLLKVDVLGLGMLTALSKALRLLPPGAPTSLAEIPKEDKAVYAMIQRGDTVGVFQIESRAQMSMLPRLKPAEYYDLVICVAIVRPGPIQGGMVHPFLRRRAGQEKVVYPHPSLVPVLKRTMGVTLFQEQAMHLAVKAAGFTPGEADEIRRAMTHKRSRERLEEMKGRLFDGMAGNGISGEGAEQVFRQLLGFSGYGFPESHAASFALLAYASSWVKCYHPAAFCCALLNSQPMGFYAPHTLIEDAKRHGVEIRGVDVTASDWDFTLEGEPPALRVGLCAVKRLPQAAGEAILQARAEQPFASLEDFVRRARVPKRWLEVLAQADALRAFQATRRDALWAALATTSGVGAPLFRGTAPAEAEAALPRASPLQEVFADFAALELSEKAHPLAHMRAGLTSMGVLSAAALNRARAGSTVQVAGMVIARQRPETAKGLVFMSLEDETGVSNLVVMPDVYDRFRPAARGAPLLRVQGQVERSAQGGVVHVKVSALAALPVEREVDFRSRDFH